MKYATIESVSKPMSRWAQGCMMLQEKKLDEGFAILDRAFERGVTVFDNGHVYGGGQCDRVFGRWLADRGCREKIVILSKGCHHNNDRKRVTPHDASSDIMDSLARMKVDCLDVWMFHRDDPEAPVGPLVEELNKHIAAGRLRSIGASNWTIPRIEEFNAYASKQGLKGIESSSPNFSLAEQIASPWGSDCLTISGPDNAVARQWYREKAMPVFTWSSLARGFFSGRVTRENYAEMLEDHAVKAYICEENWQRLSRVKELAENKGLTVAQIALAYVLNQDFNAFALASAYTEEEAEANLRAVECELTQEELAWLDLRTF